MRDAVIVSTARTPLTKAARGSFNNTLAPTLGAHAVRAAVERAGVAGGEIDDVVFGAAMQQGSQTMNVARLIALRRPRTDRRQAPRREICRRHHVHRWRPGRSGPVRGLLICV